MDLLRFGHVPIHLFSSRPVFMSQNLPDRGFRIHIRISGQLEEHVLIDVAELDPAADAAGTDTSYTRRTEFPEFLLDPPIPLRRNAIAVIPAGNMTADFTPLLQIFVGDKKRAVRVPSFSHLRRSPVRIQQTGIRDEIGREFHSDRSLFRLFPAFVDQGRDIYAGHVFDVGAQFQHVIPQRPAVALIFLHQLRTFFTVAVTDIMGVVAADHINAFSAFRCDNTEPFGQQFTDLLIAETQLSVGDPFPLCVHGKIFRMFFEHGFPRFQRDFAAVAVFDQPAGQVQRLQRGDPEEQSVLRSEMAEEFALKRRSQIRLFPEQRGIVAVPDHVTGGIAQFPPAVPFPEAVECRISGKTLAVPDDIRRFPERFRALIFAVKTILAVFFPEIVHGIQGAESSAADQIERVLSSGNDGFTFTQFRNPFPAERIQDFFAGADINLARFRPGDARFEFPAGSCDGAHQIKKFLFGKGIIYPGSRMEFTKTFPVFDHREGFGKCRRGKQQDGGCTKHFQLHYFPSAAKFRSASSQKRRMILISFGSYGRRLGRKRSCCHLVKSSRSASPRSSAFHMAS